MKFITLILLLTCSLLNAQDWSEDHSAKAEALLNKMVKDGSHAGATAGVATNDEILWVGSHGYADVKSKTPHSNSTITRLASIAKPMTAVAILQLVEKGMIDLDAPIQTYLPTYPRHKEGDITTRQLLQHSSGMPAYKNIKEIETKHHYSSLESAIEVFKNRKLEHKPGTAYYYTTYGYVVLGRIIEQVSGLSYETYMQQNIWDKRKTSKANNLSNRIPGGGFQSTSEDILKFGQALLNNTLISQTSFDMMIADPQIRAKEAGNGYGMGCYLYGQNDKKGFVFGHSGGQTGCSSQLMILPDAKLVTVALSNTANTWEEAFGLSVQIFKLYGADLDSMK